VQELDIRDAAKTASQLVSQKLHLQNLQAVLEDLAGQQNLARELKESISTSRADIERLQTERLSLESSYATRLREINDDLASRKAVVEAELARLGSECDALGKRRTDLAALAEREEARLSRVRTALDGAATTVGAA